jgi:hypothetical protein
MEARRAAPLIHLALVALICILLAFASGNMDGGTAMALAWTALVAALPDREFLGS